MNIVTPNPTAVMFTPANVNTEAARRDNVLRETVPQTGGLENSAAETGLGSESDRVKTPGQQQPVVYERPQIQQQINPDGSDAGSRDNGEDPSAGRENAESRQEQQQQQAEQREIEDLKARDLEVRAHEQAHAAVGGQYAGSPTYEFETGPDGRQYAVAGEVSIDISKEGSPEDTIRKMQQVRAAALAPTEPSPQDLRVAGEATQLASEARSELNREKSEEAARALNDIAPSVEPAGDQDIAAQRNAADRSDFAPDLEDIVDDIGTGVPTRQLNEDPVAEAVGLASSGNVSRELREDRDQSIVRRASVIENFYQSVAAPRPSGLQQSA